jgi:ElaB/YqjD/DUF883 family membrane-anchored ribosome-binding protein
MKSDEIQHDIERTRGEMETTLEAIERKLSPRQLMDQAVDTMRDFASDTSRIGDAVRENPLPLALIGLGIGWLAVNGMRGRSLDDVLDQAAEAGESALSASSAWGTSTTDTLGDTLGETIGGDGRGQRLRAKASDMAGQARDALSGGTETARMKVSEWSSSARAQANQAAEVTWETYQEHPLTMGAAAVLLGAAIGALLPRTRQERAVMGEAAGTLMRGANQIIDKAGRVANRVVRTARQEGAEALGKVQETAKEELARENPIVPPASTLTH